MKCIYEDSDATLACHFNLCAVAFRLASFAGLLHKYRPEASRHATGGERNILGRLGGSLPPCKMVINSGVAVGKTKVFMEQCISTERL